MTRVLEGLDIPNRVALFRSEIIPNLIDRLAFILVPGLDRVHHGSIS
jgi:hypothetical protein